MADPVKPILERIREKPPRRKTKVSTKSPQNLEVSVKQNPENPDTSTQPTKNADGEDDQDLWRLAYNELPKENPKLTED